MTGVQQQVARIDKFLTKEMMINKKTKEEIQALRSNQCIEVAIQGTNTELFSIEGLEAHWLQKQNNTRERVCVPSTDILEWKAKCPLSQTTADIAASMKNQYMSLFDDGLKKLIENESLIDQELKNFNDHKDAKGSANKITEIVSHAVILATENKNKKKKDAQNENSVTKKLKREIEAVLLDMSSNEHEAELFKVFKNILHEGINNKLKQQKEWGLFINRRGQIGENKTMAAMNNAVKYFGGFSVLGMKTYSYLQQFLESLNINLTYRNTMNDAGNVLFHEVEHDGVLTWMEEEELVLNMIQSKTNQLQYLDVASQEERRQAAVKHGVEALKQVAKDFLTFKEIFLDISINLMKKIRYKYCKHISIQAASLIKS